MKNAFIVFLISFNIGAEELNGSLSYTIENLKNEKGVVQVLLFKTAKGFPDTSQQAVRQATLAILSNKVQGVFTDLPYGTYALSCIHDENQNQKLDTNFLGYPLEGFGASKNPTTRWRKPHFEEASFHLEKKELNLNIRMKYLQ